MRSLISSVFLLMLLACGSEYDIDTKRIVHANDEPENWLAHGRTYDEQRFSPLTDISAKNVNRLGLSWFFETGDTRGLEASPIVLDGTMFITGNWGKVHALDAKTGKELWSFDPEVPGQWARYGCCDIVNRGVAVWEGKVIVASFDGRLIALDGKSGKKIWEVNTIDRSKPYTITGAPRIINGKILIGNGGAELGVRGYVSAYDVDDGKLLWRFYTVPGDPSKPFEHSELEPAAKTWKGGKWWEIGGGGTVWDSMAYDPELNLVYIGVGNGSPWTRHIRSPGGGDNLYLSSIIALNPDNGEMKWYYQTTPGDNWDYTATQHIILADMHIKGKPRKVLMQAPKNGFFYVIDRKTGELLRADPYATITWAKYVDLKTGRPVENEKADYAKKFQYVLPSALGGHNWQPMAYHPKTELVYIPVQEAAGIYTLSNEWKKKKKFTPMNKWWNTGLDFPEYLKAIYALLPNLPINRGYLRAWDPTTGKLVWQVEHPNFWNGGVLATGGNLIFQGTGDGRFIAYSADKGKKLWEFPVFTGIIAPPISYKVDGVQYIAVMAGYGGAGGTAAADARTAVSAKYKNNGKLLVFRLDGKAKQPETIELSQNVPRQPRIKASQKVIEKGSVLYMESCSLCHGALGVSGGVVPDLRLMNRASHRNFQKIVRRGALAQNGMPNFGDLYSKREVQAIHAYIVLRANQDRALQQKALKKK